MKNTIRLLFLLSLTATALSPLACGDDRLPVASLDASVPDSTAPEAGADTIMADTAASPDGHQPDSMAPDSAPPCKAGWTEMTSDTTAHLLAVGGSGPSDVYAAGEGGLWRHNGKTWSPVKLGPARTGLVLRGVWAGSPSNVFAVGYYQPGNIRKGIAYRFDGKSWASTEFASSGDEFLTAVWGAGAKDVHAVGFKQYVPTYVGYKRHYHFDGAKWRAVDLNSSPAPGMMTSVWGSSSDNVLAVGRFQKQGGCSGFLYRYDGKKWSQLSLPTSPYPGCQFGVWNGGLNDFYMVGYYSSPSPTDPQRGTITYNNGKKFTQQKTTQGVFFRGVWSPGPAPSSKIYVVGDKGTILARQASAWGSQATGTTESLNAVWGSGPKDIFAVGDKGTILHSCGK